MRASKAPVRFSHLPPLLQQSAEGVAEDVKTNALVKAGRSRDRLDVPLHQIVRPIGLLPSSWSDWQISSPGVLDKDSSFATEAGIPPYTHRVGRAWLKLPFCNPRSSDARWIGSHGAQGCRSLRPPTESPAIRLHVVPWPQPAELGCVRVCRVWREEAKVLRVREHRERAFASRSDARV